MQETELERMIVRILGDTKQYQASLAEATAATTEAADRISGMGDELSGLHGKVSGFINATKALMVGYLAALGVNGITGTMQSMFSKAIDAEQMELAFTTLIGNAEKAKVTLADLKKFAAETPYELPELMAAAKELIALDFAPEQIVQDMRMLGDVASGLSTDLGSLVHIFGTLKAQGRATSMDMMQFAGRGIPIFEKLSLVLFGVKDRVKDVKEMVSEGKIGFNEVNRAFKLMTSDGGKFTGMMEKQSQTLGGLISTLKDGFGETLTKMGKELIEGLNLKGLVRDIGAVAGAFAAWFTGLSAGTKGALMSLVVAIPLVVIALGTFIGAIVLAGKMFNLYFFGIGIVIGLIVTAFAGLTVATAGVISSLGGVGAVMNRIRDAIIELWEWSKPIRQALESLADTTLKLLQQAFVDFKDFLIRTWQEIVGETNVDWNDIRDTIVRSILTVEFALLNLERVFDVLWKSALLGFVVVKEEMQHFFSQTLPVLLANMATMMQNVATGEALFKGVQSLPKRMVGPMETQLKKIVAEMWDNLDQDRKKFVEQRLKEFGLSVEEVQTPAEKVAQETKKTEENIKKSTKEVGRFDAALYGSAEALSRIEEFAERVKHNTAPAIKGAKAQALAPAHGGAVVQPNVVASNMGGDQAVIPLLNQIAQNTKIMATKVAAGPQPANLED